jgi:hypothetical protein
VVWHLKTKTSKLSFTILQSERNFFLEKGLLSYMFQALIGELVVWHLNSQTNHSIFRWFLPLHWLFLDLLCFVWYISFRFVILHFVSFRFFIFRFIASFFRVLLNWETKMKWNEIQRSETKNEETKRTNHSIFRWFLSLHWLFLDLLCFVWYISFRFVILYFVSFRFFIFRFASLRQQKSCTNTVNIVNKC